MLSHRNYVANIAQLVPYRLMENSATTVQVMPMFHCTVLYCTVLYCADHAHVPCGGHEGVA